MTAPERYRQSMLTREKDFSTSTSGFIGTILSPTTSISPTTENHLNISNRQESSQLNQQIDFQKQTLHFEQKDEFHQKKSHLIQNHFEITSKPRTKNKQKIVSVTDTIVDETQSNSEDDWVLFNLKNNTHFFALYSGVSRSCGIEKSRL
jgi:hypothetical protein